VVGVDLNLFKLLIVLRRNVQAQLGHCLTVGRQQIHFEASEARAACKSMRYSNFADQADLTYGEYCETLLSHLGATSVDSIDASSYEGATIVHDLNKPLPADLSEQFDSVIDFGTIEHVFDVPQVLRTYASLVRDGGIILIATQADGCCGHGFYQFSPELFYRFFATERGFETKCFLVPCGSSRRSWVFSPDPASSNSRIEFPVMGRTYVVAIARRRGPLARLDSVQQSDYARLWRHDVVAFYARVRLPGSVLSLVRPVYISIKKWLRDTALGHAAERGLRLRLLPIRRFKPENFPDYNSLSA
jgi:SAM-dependent methyltransferase